MEKDLVKFATARACAAAAAQKANSNKLQSAGKEPPPPPPPKGSQSGSKPSRLTRMLSSLERSILGQFGAGSSGEAGSTSGRRKKRQPQASGGGARTAALLASSAAGTKQAPVHTSRAGDSSKRKASSALRAPEQAFCQQKSEKAQQPAGEPGRPSKSKMTLNKCQQQIVSTLRLPSRQQPAGSQPARLSIPPPHANDEARSQNHRLLFGQPTLDTKPAGGLELSERLAALAPSPPSSAKSLPNGHRQPPAQQQPQSFHFTMQNGSQEQESNQLGNSRQIAKSTHSINREEDASGFHSYQSQRSLASLRTGAIKQQQQQQQPAGNCNTIGLATDKPMIPPPPPPANFANQNNATGLSYFRNYQKQLPLQVSNQVPIMQAHPMQQQLSSYSQASQRPLSSDLYNLYAGANQKLGYQPLYVTNQQLLAEQQIYANAPPKPRRYQYYEAPASQQHQLVFQQQQQQSAFLRHYQQQSYQQQQANQASFILGQAPKPPLYSLAGYQLQGSPVMSRNSLQPPPQFQQHPGSLQQSYAHHHQPAFLPALTKSKSSLDIRDLMDYRQQQEQQRQLLSQQQQFSTLRQPAQLQRAPIYSSQLISQAELTRQLPAAGWYASGQQARPAPHLGLAQPARQQLQPASRPAKLRPGTGNETSVVSVNENSNSQLIVDLTTPRVLAKTQTTLLAAPGQRARSASSWSINQSGLPSALGLKLAGESPEAAGPKEELERSAPYYYSDLKSNEQQLALLNIVQAKSLSPPPALLSRSADQNNTRLAARSATLQASQAQALSETLAAKQLHYNLMQLQQQHCLNQQQRPTSHTGILKSSKLLSSPSNSSGSSNQNEMDQLASKADQLSLASSRTGSGASKDKPESSSGTNGSSRDSHLSLESGAGSGSRDGKQSAGKAKEEPMLAAVGANFELGNNGEEGVGLGNVIDVDVCSLNNMSQFSPFNSHHLLKHHQSLTILN